MAIEQKIRSLYCGLPAGLQFQEVDGMTVLPLASRSGSGYTDFWPGSQL